MATTSTRTPARERLLDAAEALFAEQGLAATGVDAVLRRAGVAPATLYAHFAGKDGLVAAYLERRHLRWRAVWDEVLEACGDDAEARAVSVLDALAELHRRDLPGRGCAFLAASVEVTDAAHPAHRWLVEDSRLLSGRLTSLAAATGAADADALAAELLLLYDGALAARSRALTAGPGGPVEVPDLAVVRALAVAAVRRHRRG